MTGAVLIRAMMANEVPPLTRAFNQRSVASGTRQVPHNIVGERHKRYQQTQSLRVPVTDDWYGRTCIGLELHSDNAPAIHLYSKFGFVIEGNHTAYALREGAYIDAVSMGQLRPGPSVRVEEGKVQ